MFFKRIEMLGFKSFATKTTIEFRPGVTIIVGPNGCGKSNILDAIRWVLGEQSARSMRGKKMSDIIFGGSTSFKPLGLSQVTLTLDNSRRTLDIDYDEVQIARRLYRTGESEYLLNKVPCRLKDIQGLFLGTGIGTSSYSILQQGQVDMIINAKPIERRFLFEEAAGISKYRIRKLEAVRKLERTATDLKRLDDMIVEIQRQVNSLKRQAGKAERYHRFSGELRQTEMELFVLRSGGLGDEIKSVRGEIAQGKEKLERHRTDHAQRAAEEQQGRQRVDAVDAKLSKDNQALYEIKTAIKDLEHQSHLHADRIESNKRRLAQIDEEFGDFETRNKELIARKEELSGRRAQAVNDEEAAKALFEERRASYAELQSEVGEKTEQLERMNREMLEHREELARCENEVRMAEALIARHDMTRGEVESEIEKLRAQTQSHGERRGELEKEIEKLDARIAEKENALSSSQVRHAETHSRIAELSDELRAVRQDLHQREARLMTLRELKANFEGFQQGVREVMERADRGELSGILGPLATLVTSKKEHETALEAALESHLQDIVVENPDAARAAMKALTQNECGRATFRPLDRASAPPKPKQLAKVLKRAGVVGYGPDLVEQEKKDERIASIAATLLATTVVVNDLETAEALASDYGDFTYVCLDGKILDPSGAMTGGTFASAGLLGREREIHELTESVAQLNRREKEIQTRTEKDRKTAEELSQRIEAATGELHELKVARVDVDKDRESAARACEETNATLTRREEQLAELVTEIESKRALIAKQQSDGEEHRRLMEELSAAVEAERQEARSRSEEFIARGAQLAQARAEIEKMGERLHHIEEQRGGLEREEAALSTDRQGRTAERERLNEEIAQCESEIQKVREGLEGQFQKQNKLEHGRTEHQDERERLNLNLRELQHRIEQSLRDERAIENELHERELRHTELETSLKHIEDQAREKFDRGLAEIAAERGEIEREPAALTNEVAQLREKLDRMGPVNMAALEEYQEQSQRLDFLTTQQDDLVQAKRQIEDSIAQIDETTKRLFHETFESVRKHFIEMFRRLFSGGKADLIIDQEVDDPLLDGGIEILAQPPGKKLQTLSLMSGGEKAMTAIALLFGLFLHKPAPFAILDEIDAPLDDSNVERFKAVVSEFALDTQFVIISHNKQTIALADVIYGVTMEESGVSKLVSVQFEHADQYITPVG